MIEPGAGGQRQDLHSGINTDAEEVPEEKIEILSVSLLDENRPLVEDLKHLAHSLRLEFGWHYLLDLSWVIRNLGPLCGKRIMDAGAGTGIIQWFLAQNGAEVISVDRLDRSKLPLRFRKRFNVRGLGDKDLDSDSEVMWSHLAGSKTGPFLRRTAGRLVAIGRDLQSIWNTERAPGSVIIYHQDLADLRDISDNSLDAVVSISALEHNSPEQLRLVVTELMRVIKPGGRLLASLTASGSQDWWHEASQGWCYSEASLRRLFDLPANLPSNFHQYDQLFASLKDNRELRENLARFYRQTDNKGMPRGIWNPEYQPVGVCKIKKVL